MRPALEILACIVLGLLTGAVLMITWHGVAASLDIARCLLRYVYEEQLFSRFLSLLAV